MNSYSCQHVGAINKSEVEKTGLVGGTSAEFKKDSHFLIISAEAALDEETMKVSQCQLWDNDSSEARSYLKQVFIVKCSSCDKSIGVLRDGKYNTLNEALQRNEKTTGWRKVESNEDRIILFILCQIIYREYEVPEEEDLQVEYELPYSTDIAKLLWVGGNAAGFYTLKPKGTFDVDLMDCYTMTVLDTLFIRKCFRRKGYASSAIEDILLQYPTENIGLSVPISLSMVKVLKKHFHTHPSDRTRLWEITGCGSEGNRQILWYSVQR